MVELVDPVDDPRQHALDGNEARLAARSALRDLEHRAFRVVDDLARLAPLGLERAADDEVAGRDELPQHRAFADDVGIGADVRGGRRVARERAQVGEPPDLFEQALALEVPGERDRITGLAAFDETRDRLEDQAVIVAVEILGDDPIGDLVPGGRIEHEPAEHRLLGFDRVGRQAQSVPGAPRRTIADAYRHVLRLRSAAWAAATLRRRSLRSASH